MRAEAEFRSVCFSDEDRARLAQALDHQAVGGGHEISEDRRALSRPNTLDVLQVFHSMRNAMQRTQMLAAGQLSVALLRLLQQPFSVLESHQRVDTAIEPLNMSEVGRHDFHA